MICVRVLTNSSMEHVSEFYFRIKYVKGSIYFLYMCSLTFVITANVSGINPNCHEFEKEEERCSLTHVIFPMTYFKNIFC